MTGGAPKKYLTQDGSSTKLQMWCDYREPYTHRPMGASVSIKSDSAIWVVPM